MRVANALSRNLEVPVVSGIRQSIAARWVGRSLLGRRSEGGEVTVFSRRSRGSVRRCTTQP
jgi:hypothetical protein